ncbi:hypothetical protein [Pseudomonas weihenstephanensis]|uniref:hypothetical protein n=1 Tax=Pseudomonas weihenstephanensis TaxID=1608994 RepID=UPI000652DDEF|nr:hypothetical protein [Pseudomonas weihenstephanensis]KMN19521.1 hypothetical protein TU87_04895 [Pseudomonas weihenstephanensis]MBM1192627.1 hypothetical protein [Pseudomonas weihenstephanensis]
MLITTQNTSSIFKAQRPDLDPVTGAASALYSGQLQNAQPLTNLQATPASAAGNAQADNVNAAFAKTLVLLQSSVPEAAAVQSTGTQNTQATAQGSATEAFKDYMSKPVAQRIREQLLKEMGLTEDDVKAMPPEKQQAINDKISDLMRQKEAIKQAEIAQQKQQSQV